VIIDLPVRAFRCGNPVGVLVQPIYVPAAVFMIDNLNTPGYGGDFVQVPGSEDTFKLRELSDGSKHRVIKNYFESRELREILAPHARDVVIDRREHYWWLSYTVEAAL